MGLFDSIGKMFTIWLILMAIGVPILIIRAAINEKKTNENVKEIQKGLDKFDEITMTSGSCKTCVYRNGDHTKWPGSEIIYCFKLSKEVNWVEEDFSKEHPCPYFEGDPQLLTKRR